MEGALSSLRLVSENALHALDGARTSSLTERATEDSSEGALLAATDGVLRSDVVPGSEIELLAMDATRFILLVDVVDILSDCLMLADLFILCTRLHLKQLLGVPKINRRVLTSL
jgi:hypothetical protein